jgi:hypothetical protein
VLINVLADRQRSQMNRKDLLSPSDIRLVNRDMSIESARSHQRWIQHIRSIRTGEHHHMLLGPETIHLDQQLIQRRLSFIIPAESTALASRLSDRVDFIHKDDTRRVLFRVCEQVSNSGRADTDEHFDEFGTRDGEEGYLGFTGRRFGEQGFTRSWGTGENRASRDLGSEFFILERVL